MQALLPYLKQIAEALISRNKEGDKKGNEALSSIEKTISVSTAKQTSAAAEGNANTSAIGATLEKGLLLTVEEEQGGETVQVVKSVFQVIMDSILAKMEDALFVTVTENNQQVRKSLAQLVLEHDVKIAAIDTKLGYIRAAQEHISDALYDDSGATTITVLTKLADVVNKLDTIGTNIGSGNNTLSSIDTRLETANDTLDKIDDNTQNIQVTAYVSPSEITDAIDDSYVSNIFSKISDIKDKVQSIDNKIS